MIQERQVGAAPGDLVTILEAVADGADSTKDPEVLTEHARRALTNTIARVAEQEQLDRVLHAAMADDSLELPPPKFGQP